MKLKVSLLLFAAVLFMNFSSDPIQDDLLNYINVELPKVADLESEAIDAYSSVSGDNYTSDAVMDKKIREVVLPKYKLFTSKLKAIKPKTKQLKEVHAEYVEAAKDQLEAFNFIVDAIKKQDKEEIERANKDLRAAATLISNWKTDVLQLCKDHNVILN
jgi:hypothetical protein